MNESVVSTSKMGRRASARVALLVRDRATNPGQLGTMAVLLGAWVLLMAATAVAKPDFLSASTFTSISYTAAGIAAICLGLAVVTMSGGGLDLSGGIVAAGGSVLCAKLLTAGTGEAETVAIVLLLGLCVGAFNGTMVAGLGLDPILTTLAVSFVGVGVLETNTTATAMPTESALRSFSFDAILGITLLAWVALAMILLAELFLRRTRPGRHVMALGGNPIAAERHGISLGRIRFLSFVFSGFCAAIGGLMLAGMSDQVRADITNVRQFEAVAAVLLAGIALAGGRGRLLGLVASIVLVSSIKPALVTLGLSSGWTLVAQGMVLGIALSVDGWRARRRTAR